MSRKRQRSRAALTDDDDDDQPVPTVDESEPAQDHGSKSHPDDGDGDGLTDERKKQVAVWDAFKEEHHEVLEQLPLSLHRQFQLTRELDSQSEVLQADLLASVRRYVSLRESLAAQTSQGSLHAENAQADATHVASVERGGVFSTALQADTDGAPPASHQLKAGETTRTLLQHVAQTSEEAIRAAEEKVSIAQTAYETVDRHIRLLDQAIKEQEAAISLGARPGTHLAPILLPDLVVPRWARSSRVEHSPVPSLSPEPGLYLEEPPASEAPAPQHPHPPLKVPKKGKKVAAPKPTKPEKEEVHLSTVVDGQESAIVSRTRRTGVRLTIPAQPQPPGPSVPAHPSEIRYCYCNQVSFGTMIACDNEGCKLEWFHLECTGLSDVPSKKTKWYCRDCRPKMTQRGRSRM